MVPDNTIEISGRNLSYEVRHFDFGNPNLDSYPVAEYAKIVGTAVDGYFVLWKSIFRPPRREPDYETVFGVSPTIEEADRRLYKEAKKVAEHWSKGHNISNLEDLTVNDEDGKNRTL